MGSVRTSIIGGPRPSPPHRRATPRYTLDCEEPLIHLAGVGALHQVQDNRRFPLLLSLWAMQGQSEQIRDLIRRNFDGITETNNHVYGTVLEHYGLTMRPPFTLDQLTVVLTGLVQGLAIRSAVDPAAVPLELPDTAPTDNTGSTGGGA